MTHRPAYPDGRRRPPLPRVAPKPRHAAPVPGPGGRAPADAPPPAAPLPIDVAGLAAQKSDFTEEGAPPPRTKP